MTDNPTPSSGGSLGDKIKAKLDMEWGFIRQTIAAHPLTAFWSGVLGGFVAGMAYTQIATGQ